MSSGSNTGQDVPVGDLLVVLGCIVAVALLVVSLPSIGAALGSDDGATGDQQSIPEDTLSATGVIGGGAGGAAPVSPIGVEDGSDAVTPFRNQSAARAYTVTTAAPGYWRTDAYTEYDGQWRRTGQQTPYTSTLPSSRPVTAQVTQNVTTAQPTAVFPAAYQPGQLNVSDPTALTVSSEQGIHPETRMALTELSETA